jgi:hypothetical protein
MSGILSQFGLAEELQVNTPAITGITSGPTGFNVTFASAHGLLPGDTLVLAGFTPSAYNGTWSIAVVATTTTAAVLMTANPGTSTVQGTYTASLYGRPQTPTRFFDFNTESLKLAMNRIESAGLRASTRVQRSDRWAVNKEGGAGDTTVEVQSRGFGVLFKQMLGTIATAGPTDSAYTHTATVGPLTGHSFTTQVGKPFTPSQVVQPFTHHGMKIGKWELSSALDGLCELKLTWTYQDEDTTTALAVASYAVSELFSFAGATITIGGISIDVTKVTITGDNKLADKRRYLRSSTLMKEPIEEGMRDYAFSVDLDFTDLSHYQRYTSMTAAGAMAALTAAWTAPTLIGATTFPSLVVTCPVGRQDGETPNVTGPKLLVQSLPFKVLNNGSTSPVSIAYTTLDATP